jgi:hypothetical protein
VVRLLYPRDCRYRALLSTHLFVVSTYIEALTLRLSSVAFTLIMTTPCFITPTVVALLEKEGVTKPDVPNDCDWYVWRCNGKRYVKQLRTIASIDYHTDGNTIAL